MKTAAALPLALGLGFALALVPAACGGKKEAPAGAPAAPSMAAGPAPAAAAGAPSEKMVATTWTGSQAAADSTPARKVTLETKADGTAVLTVDLGGKVTIRNGKWRTQEMTVSFDPIEKDGSPGSRINWSFQQDGRLAPTAWSGDDWGSSGPPVLEKAAK